MLELLVQDLVLRYQLCYCCGLHVLKLHVLK